MFILLILLSIGFASAASYSTFSFSDFLNSIDESLVVLGGMFIICFGLIFLALGRIFKEKTNKANVGIISCIFSFLIVYWVNKTGFDFEGLFFNVGISSEILYPILYILIIAAAVFVAVKWGIGIILIIIGGTFIVLSSSDFIYEKTVAFVIGAVLTAIGVWRAIERNKKKKKQKSGPGGVS